MELYASRINENTARLAQEANSFRDYKENSATDSYICMVEKFDAAVSELIEKNKSSKYPASLAELEYIEQIKNRYAAKLAEAINKHNSIRAMCPSVMICGAGNFPTRKKEKQISAENSFWQKYGDLYSPTDNYYYKKIRTMLTSTTIYSDDDLAIEKLRDKVESLKENHEIMKSRNAYYRKNGTLKGYEGITDEKAEELDSIIKEGIYNTPYPSWQLQNSNANIKNTEKRIAELERLKEGAKETENKYPVVEGVEVVENAEIMRLQLIFDGKPDEYVRSLLKSNGFRWSPRYGAWQRQLTDNAIYATKRVLNKLNEE